MTGKGKNPLKGSGEEWLNAEIGDSIIKKLDLILIVLLAKSGLSQKEIAKILGISNTTIWKIFGESYDKIQVK